MSHSGRRLNEGKGRLDRKRRTGKGYLEMEIVGKVRYRKGDDPHENGVREYMKVDDIMKRFAGASKFGKEMSHERELCDGVEIVE